MRQQSTAFKVRRLAVTLVLPVLLMAGVLPPASAGGVPTFVDPPESLRAGTVSVVARL